MTVEADPDYVIKQLLRAENEGCDRNLIQEQKQFADKLLCQAICNDMEKVNV